MKFTIKDGRLTGPMMMHKESTELVASMSAHDVFLDWKAGVVLPPDFRRIIRTLRSKELFTLDKLMSEHIQAKLRPRSVTFKPVPESSDSPA